MQHDTHEPSPAQPSPSLNLLTRDELDRINEECERLDREEYELHERALWELDQLAMEEWELPSDGDCDEETLAARIENERQKQPPAVKTPRVRVEKTTRKPAVTKTAWQQLSLELHCKHRWAFGFVGGVTVGVCERCHETMVVHPRGER